MYIRIFIELLTKPSIAEIILGKKTKHTQRNYGKLAGREITSISLVILLNYAISQFVKLLFQTSLKVQKLQTNPVIIIPNHSFKKKLQQSSPVLPPQKKNNLTLKKKTQKNDVTLSRSKLLPEMEKVS